MYRFIDEKGEHLHELDGKPLIGTSTVVGVLSKPLTWWASGLAVSELGWIKKADPRKSTQEEILLNAQEREQKALAALHSYEHMYVSDYLGLLDKAYAAHANSLKKSATKGTDMHAELERYIKEIIGNNWGVPVMVEGHPAVERFALWADENVKRFIISEGHCYSERLWTGGITDCIAEMKDGQIGILDFKSSKEAYLSQFFQCAGYDIAASENGIYDNEGNKLYELERPISFYAVFPFGAENMKPQFHYDIAGARKGFEACVVLHKLINQN